MTNQKTFRIIDPNKITIVFKCEECGQEIRFNNNPEDSIEFNELISYGLEDLTCDKCDDGEIKFNRFEEEIY